MSNNGTAVCPPPPLPDQQQITNYVASHPCLTVTVVRQFCPFQNAETSFNKKGPGGRFLTGQLDSELCDDGLVQAKALAHRLRKTKFDHIFTSDLKRSAQTTQEIEKYQSGAKISVDVRLREQNISDLAGKKLPEVEKILKLNDKHMDGYLKSHGGETREQLKIRILEFYSDLIIEQLVEPHYDFLESISTDKQSTSTEQSLSSPNNLSVDSISPPVPQAPPILKSESAPANSDKKSIPPLQTSNLSAISITITSPSPRSPSFQSPHPLLIPITSVRTPQNTPVQIKPSKFHRSRFPIKNILIVTHGGPIKLLFKHLIEELGFTIDPARLHRGYPKCTSVNTFTVTKKFFGDGDYEWRGEISAMNDVGHFAMAEEKWCPDEAVRRKLRATRGKIQASSSKDLSLEITNKTLPSLPAKSDFTVDSSSWSNPTPNSSPERSAPQVNTVKRSLGW